LSSASRGANEVTVEERYKIYSAFAEMSRKWVSVIDTKAGFIAALNLGLIGFLWTGAKMFEFAGLTRWLTVSSTVFALTSLLAAIWVVLPRESLREIFGRKLRWNEANRPVSFYGYVASEYGASDFEKFEEDVSALDQEELSREALKQHFVISHSVAKKSAFLKVAGVFLLSALICVGVALGNRILADEGNAPKAKPTEIK
jgi:hypothetical protein